MQEERVARTEELQRRLADARADAALLTDADTIYYFTGYANYLGVEWGRPTFFFVPAAGDPAILTPLMETEMAGNMAWVADIRPWEDGVAGEWRGGVEAMVSGCARLGIEAGTIIPAARACLDDLSPALIDVTPLIGDMRVVKSPAEIAVMRQAGQVAVAMAEAAQEVIGADVPEYEIALAVIAGGTRKAAELLGQDGDDRFVSPTIYNLQIMQSGHDTCMVHRRSSTRRVQRGEPVYLCFCGIANFRHYKLGFDREFFVGPPRDEWVRVYETTIAAQAAALAAIRPGAAAEDVHFAAEAVYREAAYSAGYRTGRAVGCSFLEQPELKAGEKTKLRPGMTFAVDGGVTIAGGFGARVGDSVVVTKDGHEVLTPFPRVLQVL